MNQITIFNEEHQSEVATELSTQTIDAQDFKRIALDPNKLDELLDSYSSDLIKVNALMEVFNSGVMSAFYYFSSGHEAETGSAYHIPSNLMEINKGLGGLNASYWRKFLDATEILDVMPHEMKSVWLEQLCNCDCPEFSRENVIATYQESTSNHAMYFAQRVLSVFKKLSKSHKTNSGFGFKQKLIINSVVDRCGINNHETISEIRNIVGIMIGRLFPSEAKFYSYDVVKKCTEQYGEWLEIDGGALRIKVHKKGTAHVQFDTDIADRLNQFLAKVMPLALGEASKTNQQTFKSNYSPSNNYLSLEQISSLQKFLDRNSSESEQYYINVHGEDGRLKDETLNILTRLGAKTADTAGGSKYIVTCDYNLHRVVQSIVIDGCIPNWKDHQYYPTNTDLSFNAACELDIQKSDICLEPSAGQGGLAIHLNENATLVEISKINCEILKAKGFKDVICDDFISWAKNTNKRFDKILMNPPYKNNQSTNHVVAAFHLLKKYGKLVAVVPSTFKGKEIIKGAQHTFSDVIYGQFDETKTSVVLMTVTK